MELAALALVNLICAAGMYILFSVRFTNAVQKARKNEVFKELRENVEMTIEYINTSLDAMDQKTRAFYQLVRRSEELARELEQLQKQPQRKRRKKPESQTMVQATTEKTGTSARNSEGSRVEPATGRGQYEKKESADPGSKGTAAPQARPSRSSHPVDRVLESYGADHLDLTPLAASSDEAYASGRLGPPVEATPPAESEGYLAKLGGIVRRALGMERSSGFAPVPEVLSAAPERPRARFEIPREVPGPPATTAKPRPIQDRYEPDPARGPEPVFASQPLSGEDIYGPHPDLESLLNRKSDRRNQEGTVAGRADLIRSLLDSGFTAGDISGQTGIPLSEVELVSALPEKGRRPRRTRLVDRTQDG